MTFEPVTLSVGDHVITARAAGQGRPVVLMHSLLADGSSFDPLAQLLAATHRVIVLDLPGFGGSHPVAGGLEAVADRVAAAIRALNLPEAPILVGNGFGGFVTLAVALRDPGFARRLVLADSGAVFSEPGRQAFRNMSAGVRAKTLEGIADIAMRRLFSPEFQTKNPQLVARRRERFLATDTETFHAACAALAELDLRADVTRLSMPVLILVGEQDEATPPEMSKELAALIPQSRFVLLPGCAHVPQLQAPEHFHSAIRDFIAA